MSDRVVAVDLGGVTFDYDFHRAINHWARSASADPATLVQRFRIDAPFDLFERGRITPDGYFAHLRALLGVELSDEKLAEGWNSIYGTAHHDLIAVLRGLNRERLLPVAMSNTNTVHAGRWRELYRDQLEVFAAVHCSYEMGTAKPEAAFFAAIARAHQVPLDRLVVLDDQPAVITAARALGLPSHHYRTAAGAAGFLTSLSA
ncbi:HAD family hydrolase [Streptomyces sp. NPDC021100]|uniref:HAD family hydrolase n=1 Tax=Streptomyces sp. NPDC021100 TaxID=3365114 RepID=UPI00379C0134